MNFTDEIHILHVKLRKKRAKGGKLQKTEKGLSGEESRQSKQKPRGFAPEGFQRAIGKPFGGALGQSPKLKKPIILRKVALWSVRN